MLISAPLKVNLSLKVINRQESGYHEIRSFFHSVGIFDTLELDFVDQPGISLTSNSPDLPLDQRNTVFRSVQMVLSRWREYEGGIHIRIGKAVPPGTGLGSGSADAGAVLFALQQKSGIKDREILDFARKTGADVPFCYLAAKEFARGKGRIQAEVSGIGEKITLIEPLRGWFIVLVPHHYSISTETAFSKIDRTCEFPLIIEGFGHYGENDFEKVLDAEGLQIVSAAKSFLLGKGADFAVMSGSGSSIVGYFSSKPDIIATELPGFMILTEREEDNAFI